MAFCKTSLLLLAFIGGVADASRESVEDYLDDEELDSSEDLVQQAVLQNLSRDAQEQAALQNLSRDAQEQAALQNLSRGLSRDAQEQELSSSQQRRLSQKEKKTRKKRTKRKRRKKKAPKDKQSSSKAQKDADDDDDFDDEADDEKGEDDKKPTNQKATKDDDDDFDDEGDDEKGEDDKKPTNKTATKDDDDDFDDEGDDDEGEDDDDDDDDEDDGEEGDDEDEDEDEGDEEDEEKNRFAADDQLQRKAKGVMKETQRGFGVLSNAVEKVKQATENVKSKALKVEQKWQEYGDKMDNAGSALDALSVAALAYENEVQQTFEKNEKKKSPLEEVTKDDPVLKAAEFAPDEQALDKMMKAKVHSYNCKFEPDEKFCCTQDLDWKTIWERSQKGCLKKSGKCGEDMVETSAVSRRDEAKEEVISDDWHCVADGALSIFRDSATWTDIGALENSDFLADLAGIPGSENLLADKLQQESVKKRVIVTIVCNDAEWVNILRTAQALRLCFEKEKLEKGL